MASVNLDISQRLDITCRKGDTFKLTLNFTDSSGVAIDLSGYVFNMDVRDASDSADVISNTVFDYIVNADGTTGKLTVAATATEMQVTAGTYIYDLQADVSGTITTWLYGTFTINDDVTTA